MYQLNSNKLSILCLSLFIITYLSAFKNGKTTCDRYLINNFLYLLTMLCIYINSITKLDEENIEIKPGISFMLIILILSLIFVYNSIKNVLIKHIIWLIIILSFSYISKVFYDKYDKNQIKEVLFKLMIILLICIVIALCFPQLIKKNFLIGLVFSAIILIIMRIIDYFFLNKEYDNKISTLIIVVFSGFMIYDTGRIMKLKKLCSNTIPADYLMNTSNLFLDIISIFKNLLRLEE